MLRLANGTVRPLKNMYKRCAPKGGERRTRQPRRAARVSAPAVTDRLLTCEGSRVGRRCGHVGAVGI